MAKDLTWLSRLLPKKAILTFLLRFLILVSTGIAPAGWNIYYSPCGELLPCRALSILGAHPLRLSKPFLNLTYPKIITIKMFYISWVQFCVGAISRLPSYLYILCITMPMLFLLSLVIVVNCSTFINDGCFHPCFGSI